MIKSAALKSEKTKSSGRNLKSGGTAKTKPVWLKYTGQEIRDVILNLIKKEPELTSEKIGLILRDTYGIPKTRIYGIKISEVLKEAGIYKNPDILNLAEKTRIIEAHLAKNKQDKKTGRALIVTKAKLRKAERYFAKKNRE